MGGGTWPIADYAAFPKVKAARTVIRSQEQETVAPIPKAWGMHLTGMA
jgi:hypothetical protein